MTSAAMLQGENSIEGELQSLLTDERARCNQYKQIYQTLKEEHSKLQEELTSIYQQLKGSVSQNEQLKMSNESYISKLEEVLKVKEKEIQALNNKIKSFDPVSIREIALEEASKHYDVKIKELQTEIDKNREQYNILHYDHTVLTCKLESQKSEHVRIVEQIKFQYHGEIEILKEKLEGLLKEKSSSSSDYALELKDAQRENIQLTSKIKVLLSECDELRAQNENLTLQINSLNRTNSKQLTENSANIRALESEKLKISMQRDVLEKELTNYQEQRNLLNTELQSTRQEMFTLRSKIEECEHKYHMITTNLQVELEQQKANLEADKEQLSEEILKLKKELRNAKEELSQEKHENLEKEKSFRQTLLSNRLEIWKTFNDFEQERESFLSKLSDLELNKNETISEMKRDLQATKENLQLTMASKVETEKNFVVIKQKLEECQRTQGSQMSSDVLLKQNEEYEREITNLKQKINVLSENNRELAHPRETFSRNMYERSHNANDEQEILQLKLSWEQQKLQFHQRLDELESNLRETKTSSATQKKEMEYKLKQYARLISKLRQKLELQKAQNEELEVEKEVLTKNVPVDIHMNVKKQLSELHRRLEEYRQVIAIEPKFTFLSNVGVDAFAQGDFQAKASILPRFLHTIPPAPDTEEFFIPEPQQKSNGVPPSILSRKPSRPRRKSIRERDKDREAGKAAVSPIISSSTELENL